MADVAVNGLADGGELRGDLIGVLRLRVDWRGWRVAVGTVKDGGGAADVDGGDLARTTSSC